MADVVLPAPKNRLTALINKILDGLIKGLGATAIIADCEAAEPWLKLPVISWMFQGTIKIAAGETDEVLAKNIDVVTIRFQDNANLGAYNTIIAPIKNPPAGITPAQQAANLAAAKAAIDALVNRNK